MRDVLIIGGGPAGLSAAIWCESIGLDALLLERDVALGGQLLSIYNRIANCPGLESANGAELCARILAHQSEWEIDLVTDADIVRLNLATRQVELRAHEQFSAICIVLATGVRRRTLGIDGETSLLGRGVMLSGVVDGPKFKGLDVCVVGGGDAAVENALLLAEHCATVTLIHRGRELRARREFVERLHADHRITLFAETRLTRIIGADHVEAIEVMRAGALKPLQIALRGVLVRIGVTPNTELCAQQLELDQRGYITVDRNCRTSVPNVFAIGDVSNPYAPTINGALGDGATVAKFIGAMLHA